MQTTFRRMALLGPVLSLALLHAQQPATADGLSKLKQDIAEVRAEIEDACKEIGELAGRIEDAAVNVEGAKKMAATFAPDIEAAKKKTAEANEAYDKTFKAFDAAENVSGELSNELARVERELAKVTKVSDALVAEQNRFLGFQFGEERRIEKLEKDLAPLESKKDELKFDLQLLQEEVEESGGEIDGGVVRSFDKRLSSIDRGSSRLAPGLQPIHDGVAEAEVSLDALLSIGEGLESDVVKNARQFERLAREIQELRRRIAADEGGRSN